MRHCLVAMGGNVGPVEETFANAVDSLRHIDGVEVDAVSSTHQTAPVGADAGSNFLNAAISLRTRIEPFDLLECLQGIENNLGRVRDRRWGPRTLDLDLVTFGDQVLDVPRLVVPHPGCWYRRFVLDPLVEIAADVVHPLKQKSFAELRDRLISRPLLVALRGADQLSRQAIAERLVAAFPPETVALVDEWGTDPAFVFILDRQSEVEPHAAQLPVPGDDVDERYAFVRDVLIAAMG